MSQFFNRRNLEEDEVVRKIDYLHSTIELGFVAFIRDMVESAKEEEEMKATIKKKDDFMLLMLFKKI